MIIAFTGPMKSGKTEACKYLGIHGFTRVSFKDAMIEEMKQTFPDFLNEVASFYQSTVDDLFKIKPREIRKFMQNYGTDLRRREDPNHWVDKWLTQTYNHIDICVDDCRFLNEAKAVKSRNGIIVRLFRDAQEDSHISETEMANIQVDHMINNNGTYEELYYSLNKLLTEYNYL